MEINVERIKKIMKAKGMSAYDLALRMDKRESWVYAVLRGSQGRSFGTVEDFAKALEVSEKELVE